MALDPTTGARTARRKRKRRPASPPAYRFSDAGEAVRYLNEENRRRREGNRFPPRGADTAEAARGRGTDALTRLEVRRANRDVGGRVVNRKDVGAFLASLRERRKDQRDLPEYRPTGRKLSESEREENRREIIASKALQSLGPDLKASAFATGGPRRIASNLFRQVRDAPADLGPALVRTAAAIGSDVKAELDPREPDRDVGVPLVSGKKPGEAPPLRTVEEVVKPAAEGLKYLASSGPVILGYSRGGKPIYRSKTGGKTRDVRKARTGRHAKFEETPLDYLLLGAAAPSLGGSAVVQAGRLPVVGSRVARFAQPGSRTLRARTGETVRTPTSRNPWTRAVQESSRAVSTGVTGAVERGIGRELPVVGEHARAVRQMSKQTRRRQSADIDRAVRPFERAVRPLKPKEKIALVARSQGVAPSELRAFIATRRAEAADKLRTADGDQARNLRGEVRDHDRLLKFFARTDDATYRRFDSDPKLQGAYAAAERLMEAGGDILEGLNLITPTTRALRPYLTARVVGGARFESGRKRQGAERQAERAEAKLTRQGRVVAAVQERVAKSDERTRPLTIAEAEKRIAKTERDFRKLVDAKAASMTPGSLRLEVNRRNRANRKLRNRGRPERPTIKREIRAAAEREVLQMLEDSDHPAAVRFLAELRDADRMREGLGGLRGQPNSLLPEEAVPGRPATAPARRELLGETRAAPGVGLRGVLRHEQRREKRLQSRRDVARERASQKPAEGFVGGPPVEKLAADLHKLIAFPHTGRRLREGQVPQRQSGAVPPLKPEVAKRNKAVRLLASRWLPTPDAWRDSFVKAIAYSHARARGELAYSVARPVNSDGSANDRWYYVRLDEAKPTRAARERAGLERDMDEFMSRERSVDGYLRERLVSKDREDVDRWVKAAADQGDEAPRIGQISPADYRAIFGDFEPTNTFLRRLYDRPTDFWRGLTLTYRPAWVVNNVVGQTLLYALNHSSPEGAAFYAQSVLDELGGGPRYFPEELRQGFFRSEASQAGRLPTGPPALVRGGEVLRTAVSAERLMRERIQMVNASLSDNIPRRAAWYAVAHRHRELLHRMERTNGTFDDFLERLRRSADDPAKATPEMRQLHDDLVQEVLDELIDFSNLSQFERSVIRRVVPFYSWMKGITVATARVGFEQPAKLEFLNLLAAQAERDGVKLFGAAHDILRGLVPFGESADRGRGEERGFFSTRGLNPWGTVGQVARQIETGVSRDPDSPMDNPILSLNPIVQSLIEAGSRRELFSGRELSSPGGIPGILGEQLGRSFPQADLVERTFFPEEPVAGNNRARLTVPGTSFGGIPAPVLSYLGLPVSRKNVDRARQIPGEQAREEMTPGKRAARSALDLQGEFLAAAKELAPDQLEGGKLPADLREAFARKAAVDRVRAKVAADTDPGVDREYAKFKGEVELLKSWKLIPTSTATQALTWAETAPAAEIESWRSTIVSKYFTPAYLERILQARTFLEERGATLSN